MSRQFPISSNGRALASIYISRESNRVVRFAAAELARYLGQMGSAPFELKNTGAASAGPGIFLECDAPGEGRGVCPDPFDGFKRRREGERLHLRGHNSRSVLYGVYDMLEELGCVFLEPGLEEVPKRPELTLASPDKVQVAAFPQRNLFRSTQACSHKEPFTFLDPELTIPQVDWMAKRRFNHFAFYVDYYRLDLWERHKGPILDALLDRGFTLEQSYHSLHYFCPPDENHDFGGYGPETYMRNHPDWYIPAMQCGVGGAWQTRVELPQVRRLVTERYLDYFRRNPELSVLAVWPDDLRISTPGQAATPADGYLVFWNEVADALAAEFPDKVLSICAYVELVRPPRQTRPRSNEHCWFCPMERNFQYPITHPRNSDWLEPLSKWVEVCAPWRVGVLEYYGWAVPFIPFREIMQADLRAYRELKVAGTYAWSGFTRDILGEEARWSLDFFALSQLLWNPDADLAPIEERWARGVFGSAAEDILTFHDLLKTAHHKEAASGLAGYMKGSGRNEWISLGLLRKLQKTLDGARKKASPEASARMDQLEKECAYGCTTQVCRTSEGRPAYMEVS